MMASGSPFGAHPLSPIPVLLECPNCPIRHQIIEHDAFMVCTGCGLVLGSPIVLESAEWRTFADDSGPDPNRTGAAANTYTLIATRKVTVDSTKLGMGSGALASTHAKVAKSSKAVELLKEAERFYANLAIIHEMPAKVVSGALVFLAEAVGLDMDFGGGWERKLAIFAAALAHGYQGGIPLEHITIMCGLHSENTIVVLRQLDELKEQRNVAQAAGADFGSDWGITQGDPTELHRQGLQQKMDAYRMDLVRILVAEGYPQSSPLVRLVGELFTPLAPILDGMNKSPEPRTIKAAVAAFASELAVAFALPGKWPSLDEIAEWFGLSQGTMSALTRKFKKPLAAGNPEYYRTAINEATREKCVGRTQRLGQIVQNSRLGTVKPRNKKVAERVDQFPGLMKRDDDVMTDA